MFDRQIQDIQSHFVSAVDEFERVGGKRVVSTPVCQHQCAY